MEDSASHTNSPSREDLFAVFAECKPAPRQFAVAQDDSIPSEVKHQILSSFVVASLCAAGAGWAVRLFISVLVWGAQDVQHAYGKGALVDGVLKFLGSPSMAILLCVLVYALSGACIAATSAFVVARPASMLQSADVVEVRATALAAALASAFYVAVDIIAGLRPAVFSGADDAGGLQQIMMAIMPPTTIVMSAWISRGKIRERVVCQKCGRSMIRDESPVTTDVPTEIAASEIRLAGRQKVMIESAGMKFRRVAHRCLLCDVTLVDVDCEATVGTQPTSLVESKLLVVRRHNKPATIRWKILSSWRQ